MTRSSRILLLFCFQAVPLLAQAQSPDRSIEIGVHVAVSRSREFDDTDVGVGGRISWSPISLVGFEGELTVYPGDFPTTRGFSAKRTEALFGATIGPRFGLVRLFGRLRAGVADFAEASRPFPCILIYPPPLACLLAGGDTLPAVDVGGGVEVLTGGHAFVRVDLGDRMLKYPGPALRRNGEQTTDASWGGHDFRLGLGAGWRF